MATKEHKQHKVIIETGLVFLLHLSGIWLAIEPSYNTLVLDVEGSDGRERGEDKVNFKKCHTIYFIS